MALKKTTGDSVDTGMILGTDGNDLIYGTAGDDVINGGLGDDTIFGRAGNDRIIISEGRDWVEGGAGKDTFVFARGMGSGGDGIGDFKPGTDKIELQGFADMNTFADVLAHARQENGFVTLDIKGDQLYLHHVTLGQLSPGDFVLHPSANQTIYGDAGNNIIYGGSGNDLIFGEGGNDWVEGGAGADWFIFALGSQVDGIGDFTPGVDKIWFSGFKNVFGGFADMMAHARQENGFVTVDLGPDQLYIHHVTLDQLKASDFIFS